MRIHHHHHTIRLDRYSELELPQLLLLDRLETLLLGRPLLGGGVPDDAEDAPLARLPRLGVDHVHQHHVLDGVHLPGALFSEMPAAVVLDVLEPPLLAVDAHDHLAHEGAAGLGRGGGDHLRHDARVAPPAVVAHQLPGVAARGAAPRDAGAEREVEVLDADAAQRGLVAHGERLGHLAVERLGLEEDRLVVELVLPLLENAALGGQRDAQALQPRAAQVVEHVPGEAEEGADAAAGVLGDRRGDERPCLVVISKMENVRPFSHSNEVCVVSTEQELGKGRRGVKRTWKHHLHHRTFNPSDHGL